MSFVSKDTITLQLKIEGNKEDILQRKLNSTLLTSVTASEKTSLVIVGNCNPLFSAA